MKTTDTKQTLIKTGFFFAVGLGLAQIAFQLANFALGYGLAFLRN